MKKAALMAIVAIPLAGIGIAGTAALAAGATPTQMPSEVKTSVQFAAQEIQDGLPEGKDTDKEIPDAEEQRQLQAQARITPEQAKQVAEKRIGGTAAGVELEDEDGVVVYNVAIGNQEVKVSASDGSIVRIETEDGADESNDGSSISDGDGETNDD